MEEIKNYAEKSDFRDVKTLWDECFPQFGNYVDFFMEHIYKAECARLMRIDGALAGMIHVFPRTFSSNGEHFSAKYIFGVGTSKKFRGKGVAGKLLEREACDCDFLTLIPQDKGLFEFYKKKGFLVITRICEETITEGKKKEVRLAKDVDIPYLNEIYENMCKEIPFAKRSADDWKTLLAEYEFLGGGFFIFDRGYLAYAPSEKTVYVDEFASEYISPCDVCGIFEKPCKVRSVGNDTDIAVIKPISERGKTLFEKENGCYINLMHN
ncbi:MAG: GNAT family N-acetyltransferase [Oscillospiraceae bacterium]|nr:GNAT family N-acetyltransferase [Oscillospiraceae bacterium]